MLGMLNLSGMNWGFTIPGELGDDVATHGVSHFPSMR